MDDGEEIFALKAPQDLILVGNSAGGIGGVDVERLDGRRQARIVERVSELAHVDVAHAGALEIRATDDALVEGVAARGGGQEAASLFCIGADEGGQAGDEARRHGAVGVARLAAAETDEGGAGTSVGAREAADVFSGDAGDVCGGFWRVARQDLAFECFGTLHMPAQESTVAEAFLGKHVQHGEGESTVSAGPRAEEGVGTIGRLRAVSVDAVDPGTSLAGNLDVMAEVDVGREHADAPEYDHIAFLCLLRGSRQRRAHDIAVAAALGRRADGAVEARGAEFVEERVACAVADCAHRAGVRVRQDGLGAEVIDDGLPVLGNLSDGRFPADGLETSFSLLADALQGCHDAPFGVDGALVVGHLGAERAAREGVIGVACNVDGAAILHGDEQTAAVGAVVGAYRRLDFVHKNLL